MKNTVLFLALVAAMSLVSCKKDRTCECTYSVVSQTSNQPGYTYTPQQPSTNSTTYKKVKKNNLNIQACVSSQSTNRYKSAVYTGTVITYYDVEQVSKQDCTIK